MKKDSNFFKNKFINYYGIDMTHIDELLLDVFNSDELLSLALSDYESQILLSFIGDKKYKQYIMNNNEIVYPINSADDFIELMVTTDMQIHISIHIRWKRSLLLYVIFDIKKTNLALANNKIKSIIKNIKKILNNER